MELYTLSDGNVNEFVDDLYIFQEFHTFLRFLYVCFSGNGIRFEIVEIFAWKFIEYFQILTKT